MAWNEKMHFFFKGLDRSEDTNDLSKLGLWVSDPGHGESFVESLETFVENVFVEIYMGSKFWPKAIRLTPVSK